MVQNFESYSKKKPGDRYVVEQFGWINLAEAYAQGTVEGNIDGQDLQTNGIEDSKSILGRPSDVFEAYRMADVIESRGASKGSGKSVSSPISSTEPNLSNE